MDIQSKLLPMLTNTVQQTLTIHSLKALKKTTKIISQDYYTFESIRAKLDLNLMSKGNTAITTGSNFN